jgi:hypothetical protein
LNDFHYSTRLFKETTLEQIGPAEQNGRTEQRQRLAYRAREGTPSEDVIAKTLDGRRRMRAVLTILITSLRAGRLAVSIISHDSSRSGGLPQKQRWTSLWQGSA